MQEIEASFPVFHAANYCAEVVKLRENILDPVLGVFRREHARDGLDADFAVDDAVEGSRQFRRERRFSSLFRSREIEEQGRAQLTNEGATPRG